MARLKDAIFDLASQANAHLIKTRDIQGTHFISTSTLNGWLTDSKGVNVLLPIILQSVMPALYLEELRRVDFNPFDQQLQRPHLRLKYCMLLLRARLFKTI